MPSERRTMVQVEFTPEFKRNLRHLARKYRHIKTDVQPIIEQLQTGMTPGDQITQVGYTVFKVRVGNSDIRKGKRSGYRMIYYAKMPEHVILVTIYSKSEQGDISAEQIRRIISEFEIFGK